METRCPGCDHEFETHVSSGSEQSCPRCLARFVLDGDTGATGENPEPPPLQVGTLFRGHEIQELLGRGGMGFVYKARQEALGRTVALKILSPRLAPSAVEGLAAENQFARRFEREARSLASLNHPNIVHIYEFGRESDLFFLTMEFVDGVPLRELLREKRLTSAEALKIVPQICEGLEYAHSQGVVHRDIKPENILIDRTGQVKIADFGLAKLAGSEARTSMTQTNVVMGTPHYMAPEQVETPRQVDHRADIYSLGVVFYEMLTGELPLGKFEPPSHRVQVDVRLDEVVLKALEKRPERRYQTALEVRSDVETVISQSENLPSVSVPVSTEAPLLQRGAWKAMMTPGVLSLTTQHLRFQPYDKGAPIQMESYPLTEIVWVKPANFIGIFPAGFWVIMRDGREERFEVYNRKRWIREIGRVAGNRQHRNVVAPKYFSRVADPGSNERKVPLSTLVFLGIFAAYLAVVIWLSIVAPPARDGFLIGGTAGLITLNVFRVIRAAIRKYRLRSNSPPPASPLHGSPDSVTIERQMPGWKHWMWFFITAGAVFFAFLEFTKTEPAFYTARAKVIVTIPEAIRSAGPLAILPDSDNMTMATWVDRIREEGVRDKVRRYLKKDFTPVGLIIPGSTEQEIENISESTETQEKIRQLVDRLTPVDLQKIQTEGWVDRTHPMAIERTQLIAISVLGPSKNASVVLANLTALATQEHSVVLANRDFLTAKDTARKEAVERGNEISRINQVMSEKRKKNPDIRSLYERVTQVYCQTQNSIFRTKNDIAERLTLLATIQSIRISSLISPGFPISRGNWNVDANLDNDEYGLLQELQNLKTKSTALQTQLEKHYSQIQEYSDTLLEWSKLQDDLTRQKEILISLSNYENRFQSTPRLDGYVRTLEDQMAVGAYRIEPPTRPFFWVASFIAVLAGTVLINGIVRNQHRPA